jgi:hypothetical protein
LSGIYTFATVTANQTIAATFVQLNSATASTDEQQISIYPNPTTGELKIDNGELRIENIFVFDMVGKKVMEHKGENVTLHKIDLSTLPTGVYFVRIQTANEVITQKVIRE